LHLFSFAIAGQNSTYYLAISGWLCYNKLNIYCYSRKGTETLTNYDKEKYENTDDIGEDINETLEEETEDEALQAADATDETETPEEETEADAKAEREAEQYQVDGAGDEEIAAVAERITGSRHSSVSTAAPIRTRSPEQNRNITNGIPVRHSAISDGEIIEAEEPRKSNKTLTIIIAAAIALFVIIMGAIVALNAFSIAASMRPSDYDINDTVETTGTTTVPDPVTESTQYRVTLDFYERKDIELSTSEITLSKLLEGIGCVLEENEKPSISLDTVIKEDIIITVDRYEYKTEVVEEVIAHETETIETDLIMKGTEELITGEDGAKTVEYLITYVNGVETTKEFVTETITKEPVTETRTIGVGGEIVGADGKTYTYSWRKEVTARYYSLEGPTYFGPDADETVIVVDNKVIPLGTKLYVKNDTYDFGVRTAADIASSVVGDQIYIWISPSNPNYAALKASEPHQVDIYYID